MMVKRNHQSSVSPCEISRSNLLNSNFLFLFLFYFICSLVFLESLSSQIASWQHLFYLPNVPNEFWFLLVFLFRVLLLCKDKKKEEMLLYFLFFLTTDLLCVVSLPAHHKKLQKHFFYVTRECYLRLVFFFVCVLCVYYTPGFKFMLLVYRWAQKFLTLVMSNPNGAI